MPRLPVNRTGHRWTGRGGSADDRRKTAKAIRETRALKPARKGGGRKVPNLKPAARLWQPLRPQATVSAKSFATLNLTTVSAGTS